MWCVQCEISRSRVCGASCAAGTAISKDTHEYEAVDTRVSEAGSRMAVDADFMSGVSTRESILIETLEVGVGVSRALVKRDGEY